MKILIGAIGKSKAKDPDLLLIQEYIVRLPWKVALKEIEHKDSKLAESQALLEALNGHYLIALDQRGAELSSEELASLLQNLQNQGKSKIAFAIGGANGHDQSILDRADKAISLSKMTFAHKLAKLVLVEQIYRAYTILNNHPYHK